MLVTTTPGSFEKAIADVLAAPAVAVDTETTGLYPYEGDYIIGIVVASEGFSHYFPFRHDCGDNLPEACIVPLINAIASGERRIYHHARFDIPMLAKEGMPLDLPLDDTMLVYHLLDENEEVGFSLKALGAKYIDPSAPDRDVELKEKLLRRGLKKGSMRQLAADEVAEYAMMDGVLTWKLYKRGIEQLRSRGMEGVYDLYREYARMLVDVERYGMLIDLDLLRQYMVDNEVEMNKIKAEIHQMAGYSINLNSSKQLQAWLGLNSTAAEVLEQMPDHPGVAALLRYRALGKVNGAYYSKIAERAAAGVLHPHLKITGTVTGRLSCIDPNVQALPRTVTPPYLVKRVIKAREGMWLVETDYSKMEINIAAHFGKDEHLQHLLREGMDVYQVLADRMGTDRQTGKTILLSSLYGIGAKTLAARLKISQVDASNFLREYRATYSGVAALLRRCEAVASDRGYIMLYNGRRRHYNSLSAPTHKAMSNLIQGTSGALTLEAMYRVWKELPEVHLVLQVHDSLIYEIPKKRMDLIEAVSGIMTGVTSWLDVPIKVESKYGLNLADMQPYNGELIEEGHSPEEIGEQDGP